MTIENTRAVRYARLNQCHESTSNSKDARIMLIAKQQAFQSLKNRQHVMTMMKLGLFYDLHYADNLLVMAD